jgi:hypothetical protein
MPRRPAGRPLPDAVAVRRLPLPPCAPPYDVPPSGRPSFNAPARDSPTGPLGPGSPGSSRPAEPQQGSGRVARGRRPGAGEWPSQFAQALAEALAGARPAGQVRPWTTEQARRRIRQLGPALRAEQRPRVRRVLTSVPSTDVVEMTVIIGIGARVHAMAVRLERAGPGEGPPWLCTAIEAA